MYYGMPTKYVASSEFFLTDIAFEGFLLSVPSGMALIGRLAFHSSPHSSILESCAYDKVLMSLEVISAH